MNKNNNTGVEKKNSKLSPKKKKSLNPEYKALLMKARTEGLKVNFYFVGKSYEILEGSKSEESKVVTKDVVIGHKTINLNKQFYTGRTIGEIHTTLKEMCNDFDAKYFQLM